MSYFAHPSAIIESTARVGDGTKIWHFTHIMAGSVIGERCNLGQNVVVSPGCRIGNGVKIQNNVSVHTGVTLEDDVFCGPSCVFTNVLTPRAFIERKHEFAPTLVRRGASIGANATIVCGVTLGEYCVVGAGAVVTRDVPAHALVYGNPASQRGWACFCGVPLPPAEVNAQRACADCGRRYRVDGDRLLSAE
jgi:UDP-2-acetamido-3-amino-2,3-dideoxy-glucuronate N-acetyltransferase